MRNPLAMMAYATLASSLLNRTPLPEVVKIEKVRGERLTKAEKKRARKNAQRAKLAGHTQSSVDG